MEVSVFLAFGAGILSFLSPCILPLVPSYLAYLAGVTFDPAEPKAQGLRIVLKTFSHTAAFVLGFSVVFIALGASASAIGQAFSTYQEWLRIIGGVVIVILGLHLSGVVNLSFLNIEKRYHFKRKPLGYLGSFLVGLFFAAGWTPCIGPILGSLLLYAGTAGTAPRGMLLLGSYAAGLGIPFLLASAAANSVIGFIAGAKKYLRYIELAAGLILVVFGVILVTDKFLLLTEYVSKLLPFLNIAP